MTICETVLERVLTRSWHMLTLRTYGGRRYSGHVRGGASGGAATLWVSESSLVCKMASGLRGSSVIVTTVVEAIWSMSFGLSYDDVVSSAVLRGNVGTMAVARVSVSGRGLGMSRCVRAVVERLHGSRIMVMF